MGKLGSVGGKMQQQQPLIFKERRLEGEDTAEVLTLPCVCGRTDSRDLRDVEGETGWSTWSPQSRV